MKTFMVFGFSYRYLLVYIKTLEPAYSLAPDSSLML